MNKNKEEFNFKDLVDLFAPKLWLIVLAALILGLALGGYSAFIKGDSYTSTARLMVSKTNTTPNSNDIALAASMVETYEYVIFTDNFLNQVLEKVKATEEYEENSWSVSTNYLRSVISLRQCGGTEVFDVTVTTVDPTLSYVISNALANEISDTLPEILPYRDSVIASTIIDNPMIAVSPNSKHVLRNTVIGVLGGAVIAMIAIFIYSVFDVTIREKKDLEDNFDIPVLGVIPRYYTEEAAK